MPKNTRVAMYLNEWTVDSWESYPCQQLPFYPYTSGTVKQTRALLHCLPPLVTRESIQSLQRDLLDVRAKNAFLLHCGTCAETFDMVNANYVIKQQMLLNDLGSHIEKNLHKHVVQIGRLAGQFGKPRTQMLEPGCDESMLSYFGDIVNRRTPLAEDRALQVENMLLAYHHTAEMIGMMPRQDCYLSHEAFLLPYEAALTRQDEAGHWYNLATHFPWIGKRSLYHHSPHLEYIRGINNPVGIKVSDDLSKEHLVHYIRHINPENRLGKIVLIYRFGVNSIKNSLPRYLEAVETAGLQVIWMIDPMHGNTEILQDGRKFRSTDKLLDECLTAAEIHAQFDVYLAGIHLESMNDDIMECAAKPEDIDLSRNYTSAMDPRLNAAQSFVLIEKLICKINELTHLMQG